MTFANAHRASGLPSQGGRPATAPTAAPTPLDPSSPLVCSSPLDRLAHAPQTFSFEQAVRLLELYWRRQGVSAHEITTRRLRFRSSLSLAFPASEIEAMEWLFEAAWGAGADAETPPGLAARRPAAATLTPAFLGFVGPSGVLPTFYTEAFAEREVMARDRSARAFLDIFQQRATWLFVLAGRKHRLAERFELDRRREFLPLVLALAGLGQQSLRRRLEPAAGGVADDTLAHFAGHLQRRVPSVASLRQVLASYFQVGVRIDPLVGRWFPVPPDQHTHLGLNACVLGSEAMVGDRVWQRDLRLRITLGPLDRTRFDRFLPGGPGHRALGHLLGLMTQQTLEFEVRLLLRVDAVRGARLAGDDGPRLGWDSFLVDDVRPGAGARATGDPALAAGSLPDSLAAHGARDDAGYDLQTVH